MIDLISMVLNPDKVLIELFKIKNKESIGTLGTIFNIIYNNEIISKD